MELIQAYLDILHPPVSVVSKDPNKYGFQVGTISDGVNSLEFYYQDMSYQTQRHTEPIYTHGSARAMSFARGNPEVEITMSVLLEDNELYLTLNRQRHNLAISTNTFQARVNIVSVDYLNPFTITHRNDLLIARVTFKALEFNLLIT